MEETAREPTLVGMAKARGIQAREWAGTWTVGTAERWVSVFVGENGLDAHDSLGDCIDLEDPESVIHWILDDPDPS